jgi:hypothetical protein
MSPTAISAFSARRNSSPFLDRPRFLARAAVAVLILSAMLAGAAGCKGIPEDGRYQGYGGGNRGGALTGLPVTPYDPNSR